MSFMLKTVDKHTVAIEPVTMEKQSGLTLHN